MPNVSSDVSDTGRPRKTTRSELFTILLTVGAILFVLLYAALLAPVKREPRESDRRIVCINNLKQIMLALHNYNDRHKTFPPAYTVDSSGSRLHSWRTLILPYLQDPELDALYESIDLTMPWDDPANAAARDTIVDVYSCPSSRLDKNLTTYLAVVAPEFAFPGSGKRAFREFTDGSGKTIGIVEVDENNAVHWMSPQDANEQTVLEIDSDSDVSHVGITNAGFMDGHVESMPLDVDRQTLRAMLTIAGGETIPTE